MGADKRMHPVTVLADTGNDVTLLTTHTARQLGYDPTRVGELFQVMGITGPPQNFSRIKNYIQIAKFKPFPVTMGLAHKQSSLAENLLGVQDVLSTGRFQLRYDLDSVDFYLRRRNTITTSDIDERWQSFP